MRHNNYADLLQNLKRYDEAEEHYGPPAAPKQCFIFRFRQGGTVGGARPFGPNLGGHTAYFAESRGHIPPAGGGMRHCTEGSWRSTQTTRTRVYFFISVGALIVTSLTIVRHNNYASFLKKLKRYDEAAKHYSSSVAQEGIGAQS